MQLPYLHLSLLSEKYCSRNICLGLEQKQQNGSPAPALYLKSAPTVVCPLMYLSDSPLSLPRYGWCLLPLIFTSNKCAILRECRVFPPPSPPPPPSLPVPLSIFQMTFTVGYWGAGREFRRTVNISIFI